MIDDRYVSRYIAVFPSSVRPFVKGNISTFINISMV